MLSTLYSGHIFFHLQVTLENLIDEQPELAQNDQGRVAWEGDALNKVLGKEKPGQVHGMGLLPVPKQVYGRTSHHLKNINITTVNDSSSDEETHVRGEVGELKKLVKTLGQRIEELENKGTSNGNSEPTMVNVINTFVLNIEFLATSDFIFVDACKIKNLCDSH